jgi:hypothetical protein
MSTEFEGVFMDVSIDESGDLVVSAGFRFDEDYPEEWQDYLQDVLAGLYGLLSSQTDAVVTTGKAVRSAPGFNGFTEVSDDGQLELQFDPSEELLEAIKAEQSDKTVVQFDPKKNRKH